MARRKNGNGNGATVATVEGPAIPGGDINFSTRPVPGASSIKEAIEIISGPRASSSEIVRPVVTPEQAKTEWENYIATCKAILDPGDYIYYACGKKPDGWDVKPMAFRTRDGAEAQLKVWERSNFRELMVRETKKRSAWDKLARFYGIDTPIESAALCTTADVSSVGAFIIEKLAGDSFTIIKYQEAETLAVKKVNVLLRVTAPNGRTIIGDGACSVNERLKGADSFAHPDHDIFSTAFTRAMNRGISRCIGTGEVSAEEFESDSADAPKAETIASAPVQNAPGVAHASAEADSAARREAELPGPTPAHIPAESEIMAGAKQPSLPIGSSAQAQPPAPVAGSPNVAASEPREASPQGSGYTPQADAATLPHRIWAMETFLFGQKDSENRLLRYLPFAVAVPSALTGEYRFEVNGRWHPAKWNEAMRGVADRAERIKFIEQQLAAQPRDKFIAWAEALVKAARGRGLYGK